MNKVVKIILKCLLLITIIVGVIIINGCSKIESNDSLLLDGNGFNIIFYSDNGDNFISLFGNDIMVKHSTKSEVIVEDGIYKTIETSSDILSITVDGNESKNLDGTIIFENCELTNLIYDGSKIENHKDEFDKNYVVTIETLTGIPIAAYTCNEYNITDNIVKCITLDDISLYVYNTKFQIIETSSIK